MANVVRRGDTNTAGGVALEGATKSFAQGNAIMQPHQPVTPHPCCGAPGCGAHCSARTKGGSSKVFVEGLPVIHTEDFDTCGHKRNTHAPKVFVGV